MKFSKKHSIIAATIFAVGVFLLFTGIWSRIPPRDAAASGYTYYRSITVTSTPSVASGTLTNFPVLFSGTYGWLAASSSASASGTLQNANGYDMTFAASPACSPSLNFQVEDYTSSTGAIAAWVQVPTMSTGTVIYVCYDNSSIAASQTNTTSTWNNQSLAGYWQMDEGTGSSTIDVSGNSRQGTWTGTASGTSGYYSSGVLSQWAGTFNGVNNLVQLGTGTGLAETSTLTLSAWIKMTSVIQTYIVSKSPGTAALDYELKLTSPKLQLALGTAGTARATGATTIVAGQWYFVVGTYDGTSTADVYLNGSLNGTTVATGTLNIATTSQTEIGNRNIAGVYFPGSIEDVRIYGRTLSSQEILTMYNNEASPSTFYAVGSQINGSNGIDTWVATSSNSWSLPTNWSGGVVPASNTLVLFSGSSTVSSTIDTSTAVQAFTISSTYTGAITQSSNYTLTVATSGFSQASGTFVGGGGNITINGPFSLTGGSFTSTGGKLYLYGVTTTFSGGTFNHNFGTVIFGSTSTLANVSGSVTFYDLWLGDGTGSGNSTITVATGTTLTVLDSTTFAPSLTQIYLQGGGAIASQGDILLGGVTSGTAPTSVFNLTLNGSANQTINDQGYSSSTNPFYLPSLTINKSGSGIALVSANYLVVQSTTVAVGEFRIASNTLPQTFIASGGITINSGAMLSDYPSASSTITLGSTVTNNGTIFFDGSGPACYASSGANYVVINSTVNGTQRAWSGAGNFVMRYASVEDQTSSVAISVLNGTNNGNDGANWTFPSGPGPELVQSATGSGGAGTSQLALPAFGFKPRAGDLIIVVESAHSQGLSAPTDNAGNIYTSVGNIDASGVYALGVYYAKNITPSSSLIVTLNGGGGSGQFLSGSAFEYTGISPSSTYNTGSLNPDASLATALTSLSATGGSANELYFGAMTISASTTATSGSGWTQEAGITNNTTNQALYVEDMSSASPISTAATWTAAASTTYAAVLAIFHSPFSSNYPASGTLDSATFDTGVAEGVQLNSFTWQGSTPSNSSVKFQFAVSNSSSGPWSFEGPDGTASTYFSGVAGTSINLVGTNNNGYTMFNGYRYFRYRATLFADSSLTYTPVVNQVTVNWSP